MLGRRGFLGLLAGAVATPLIKPKRSFFFFAAPVTEVTLRPGETLQAALDRLPISGGTVFLPDLTKIYEETVRLPSNKMLKAQGSLMLAHCTISAEEERSEPMLELPSSDGFASMNTLFNLRRRPVDLSGYTTLVELEGCCIKLDDSGLMLG